MKKPRAVYGVDFSGARDAGARAWVAQLDVRRTRPRLVALDSLGALAGSDARDDALAWLVAAILRSRGALWGIDAPLGLPVELFARGATWRDQLAYVATFSRADAMGRALVARCLATLGRHHVRRETDVDARTPFDCYHYRIVHQTFAAMHDVLPALVGTRGTRVAPFPPRRREGAERVVVEACPSSTLKRLGLPFRGYKQSAGARLDAARARRRGALVEALGAHVALPASLAQRMRKNRGGDALDAVLTALGAWHGFVHGAPPSARARREGLVYF